MGVIPYLRHLFIAVDCATDIVVALVQAFHGLRGLSPDNLLDIPVPKVVLSLAYPWILLP